jgi:Tfp pilus assembly protein PilF
LYTKAIQLDPENYLYYSNRAAVYMKLKKFENAANDSKKCIELKPNFAKVVAFRVDHG